MIGIKSIIYEKNGVIFTIRLGDVNKLITSSITAIIKKEQVNQYLQNLFAIIDDWKIEYINTKSMDGNYWRLTIISQSDNQKEYSGKSSYPNNFEALERLNQKLFNEVLNG